MRGILADINVEGILTVLLTRIDDFRGAGRIYVP
jgi:hypothetical protein